MAATIIEDDVVDPNEESTIPPDTEALDPQALATSLEEAAPEVTPTPSDVPDVPDKYQGKTIKEVIGMHQAAEQLIGKHSGEVGELRKVVDGFIQNQLPTQGTPAPEVAAEPVDFFEDPEGAVTQQISKHPDVIAARESAREHQKVTSVSRLEQKHPDMKAIASDPKFSEWIAGSPIRRELFVRADQQYDFDSADELFSQYKERTKVVAEAARSEQTSRTQQVKAASTGSATGATGSTSGGKIYRRADIINLMKNDPSRYEALSPEIQKAYAEGRVR